MRSRSDDSETTPLVRSESRNHDAATGKPQGDSLLRCLLFLLPYLIVLGGIEIAVTLVAVPMSAIEEAVICQSFYPDITDPFSNPQCKDHVVQSELSIIKGWEITFGLTPSVLLALPYGMAADRYGRKYVLALCVFGIFLTSAAAMVICRYPEVFPIRMLWPASMLSVVGGGPFVAIAVIFAAASDVCTKEQRSTVFFYVTAVALAGQLIGAPITYLAMLSGEWTSSAIGTLSLFACSALALACPETIRRAAGDGNSESQETPASDTVDPSGGKDSLFRSLYKGVGAIKSILWQHRQVGLLLSTLLFTTVAKSVPIFISQYITSRFGWTWSQAGLLSSVSASVNMTVVLFLLPVASQLLVTKFNMSALRKDLWIARVSALTMVVGAFGIGLAPSAALLVLSLVVYSMGCGYGPSLRSLMVTVSEEQDTGRLFAVVSVVENVAMLIAGPILAEAFKTGAEWGGNWLGLPFIVSGILFAAATVIIVAIRLRDKVPS